MSEKRTFLFGHPISHSLAPLLHNTIYAHHALPWTYTLYESFDTASFFRDCVYAEDFVGAAVTMPHKVAILSHLDGLDDCGTHVGAVNTLYKVPGSGRHSRTYRLIGTNTDCLGINEALKSAIARHAGSAVKSGRKRGLVVGGGGTTRAAVYALHEWFDCELIYLLNRDSDEVTSVVRHFTQFQEQGYKISPLDPFSDEVPSVDFIIGAIPDFPTVSREETAVRSKLVQVLQKSDKGVLLDMCYKPRHTTILQLAEREGWTTVEGIEAMIHQGIAQVSLWSGIEANKVVFPGLMESIRRADEKSQSGKEIIE